MTNKKTQVELMREEMWETFFQEIEDLLEKLESQLLDIDNKGSDEELMAGLFRTMHTFKGTSGMMGLVNIQNLAHCAEDVMDLVRNNKMELHDNTVDLLFKTLDKFSDASKTVQREKQDIERSEVEELIEEFKTLLADNIGDDPASSSDEAIVFGIVEEQAAEIDQEYISAFFELIWDNITLLKKALADNNENIDERGKLLNTYCEEMLHAAEHIGINEGVKELRAFQALLEKKPDDMQAIGSELNEISHIFWDLEDLFEKGTLNLSPKEDFAGKTTSPSKQESPDRFRGFSDNLFEQLWSNMSTLRKVFENDDLTADQKKEQSSGPLAFMESFIGNTAHPLGPPCLEPFNILKQQAETTSFDPPKAGKGLSDLYSILWDLEDDFAENAPKDTAQTTPAPTAQQSYTPETQAAEQEPSADIIDLTPAGARAEKNTQQTEEPTSSPELLDTADITNSQVFIEDYIDTLQSLLITLRPMIMDGSYKDRRQEYNKIVDEMCASSKKLGLLNIATEILTLKRHLDSNHFDGNTEAYDVFEVSLFEYVAQLLDTYHIEQTNPNAKAIHIKHAFLQWHADKIFIYLNECLKAFRALQAELNNNPNALTTDTIEALIGKAIDNLKWLAFGTQFYHANNIERVILKTEDLFMRIKAHPEMLDTAFVDNSLTLFKTLGQELDSLVEYGSCNEQIFNELLQPLEGTISVHNANHISDARDFIQASKVPECIRTNINEDELEKLSHFLEEKQSIYLLFTDLESDDQIALEVSERLSSADLDIITSITDYRDEQSVFYFLISTSPTNQSLVSDLNTIDPDKRCTELIHLNKLDSTVQINETDSLSTHLDSQKILQKVGQAQGILGQLISIKSNMAQAGANVAQIDIFEMIESTMAKNGSNWKKARDEVRTQLTSYESEIRGLLQAQQDFSLNLDKLQENLDELGNVSINELLTPIANWYQRHQQAKGLTVGLKQTIRDESIQTSKFNTLSPHIKSVLEKSAELIEQSKSKNGSDDTQSNEIAIDLIPSENTFIFAVCFDAHSIQASNLGLPEEANNTILTEPSSITPAFEKLQLEETLSELQSENFTVSIAIKDGCLSKLQINAPSDQHILDGIVVESQDNTFVFPIQFIKRIVNLSESEIVDASASKGSKMLKVGEELIPIKPLMEHETTNQERIALVLEYLDSEAAILVDELIGIRQVLTAPVSSLLSKNDAILGMAVLGRDDVGMVVNTSTLTHHHH